MSKQDRQGARTPADIERKYNFGKTFSEILGVATDARIVAEQAQKTATEISETTKGIFLRVEDLEQGMSAQFKLTIEEAEDGETGETKVYSLIDGEATEIHFKSNSLIIESDFFTLDRAGKIFATGGRIGNCTFDENGDLVIPTSCFAEKITADKINADGIVATNVDLTGRITATEGLIGDCELVDKKLVVKKLLATDPMTGQTALVDQAGMTIQYGNQYNIAAPSEVRLVDDDTGGYTKINAGSITIGKGAANNNAQISYTGNSAKANGNWNFSDGATFGENGNVGFNDTGTAVGGWVFQNSITIGSTRLSEELIKDLKALLV